MHARPRFAVAGAMIERLEARVLLANVVVDATQTVRSVGPTMVGTNLAWWQWEMDAPRIGQMIKDARLGLLRMPGGSSSNTNLHFNAPAPYGGYKTAQIMAKVVESVGADGMISVNYGTGSPQEAAAFLAYYNASVGDTTPIGMGEQWDDTNRVWVWKDWKTAGYWASLRAAAPLAADDGLNQLRANHPAPWHYTYWEVGNENFATWEKNEHTYGGTATASSEPVAGSGAAQAFDENTATKWVGTFSGSAWLQYQFFNSQPLVVRQYRITSSADIASHPNRAPKNWTLQASNDGSTWVTLDTRTNQSDITNSHQKVYTISNTTAYRYYRLNISAIRGTETQVELGELQLVYDVTTYVNFAKTFSDLAHQIDPTSRIGLVATLPMQWNLPNLTWTNDMLAYCAQVGLVPGFLSDHVYVGGQSDQNLLLHTVNDPTFSDGYAPQNWAGRTQAYRNLINAWLGANAPNVQIMLTEFNSDLSTKQVTNLVSGLWIADAMAGAMQTEYTSSLQWDLMNGYNNMADNPALYGWRTGSDDGVISTGTAAPPTSGPYIPYPAYFGASLAGMMVHSGQSVIKVTSDDPNLSAYAVKQTNGDVYLLVINKSATSDLAGNFTLSGFYTT